MNNSRRALYIVASILILFFGAVALTPHPAFPFNYWIPGVRTLQVKSDRNLEKLACLAMQFKSDYKRYPKSISELQIYSPNPELFLSPGRYLQRKPFNSQNKSDYIVSFNSAGQFVVCELPGLWPDNTVGIAIEQAGKVILKRITKDETRSEGIDL